MAQAGQTHRRQDGTHGFPRRATARARTQGLADVRPHRASPTIGAAARPDRHPRSDAASASRDIALIDLLDRLLAGGVVLTGDITLAVADIDLVQVALRALISSVSTVEEAATSQERQ
jgi:hypothetical protein